MFNEVVAAVEIVQSLRGLVVIGVDDGLQGDLCFGWGVKGEPNHLSTLK